MQSFLNYLSKSVLVFGLSCLITGCGQTGPLYLPKNTQVQQQAPNTSTTSSVTVNA